KLASFPVPPVWVFHSIRSPDLILPASCFPGIVLRLFSFQLALTFRTGDSAMPSRLSPEDQARADQVISRGTYAPERKPFNCWLMLSMVCVLMVVLVSISLVLGLLFDMT